MRCFDYILPDKCRAKLRKVFPNLHEGKFINLVRQASQALIQYERSKSYHVACHEKPSEHLRRLKLFKKHAKALKEWINKDSELQDSMFFGCDFFDSVDNDEPVIVRIANTRNALDHILYHELDNADNAIEAVKEMAGEPRITPAFFRRELVNALVSSYNVAFGYMPSVYWDESLNQGLSEDCIQGAFIDYVEIIMEEAGESIGHHTIYQESKHIISERNKPIDEQDWKNFL